MHLPLIANGGEGGERGVSDGRRLLEGEVGRLRQEVVLRGARILGEGAPAPAEHLIARSKLFEVSADRLDLTGDIEPRYRAPRFTQAGHRAHDVRYAPQEVPVADIDGRRPDPYEHMVVLDDRLVDGSELQDVRGAVPVLDDRLHRVLLAIARLGASPLEVPVPACRAALPLGHRCERIQGSVDTPEMDEPRTPAGVRSALASLLHRW